MAMLPDGLALHVAEGVAPSVARAFASSFRVVWAAIPFSLRRALIAYWRTVERRRERERRRRATRGARPGTRQLRVPSIALEVMSLELLAIGGVRHRGHTPACTIAGVEMLFLSQFLEPAPTAVVMALIAHELAHCVQEATASDPIVDLEPVKACEDQAHAMAFAWGFSSTVIQAYKARHIETWRRGLPIFHKSSEATR